MITKLWINEKLNAVQTSTIADCRGYPNVTEYFCIKSPNLFFFSNILFSYTTPTQFVGGFFERALFATLFAFWSLFVDAMSSAGAGTIHFFMYLCDMVYLTIRSDLFRFSFVTKFYFFSFDLKMPQFSNQEHEFVLGSRIETPFTWTLFAGTTRREVQLPGQAQTTHYQRLPRGYARYVREHNCFLLLKAVQVHSK